MPIRSHRTPVCSVALSFPPLRHSTGKSPQRYPLLHHLHMSGCGARSTRTRRQQKKNCIGMKKLIFSPASDSAPIRTVNGSVKKTAKIPHTKRRPRESRTFSWPTGRHTHGTKPLIELANHFVPRRKGSLKTWKRAAFRCRRLRSGLNERMSTAQYLPTSERSLHPQPTGPGCETSQP